jgi:sulfonate transport system substrate-binding protein
MTRTDRKHQFDRRKMLLALAVTTSLAGTSFTSAFAQDMEALPEPVKLTVGAAKVAHLAPIMALPEILEPLNVELEIVEFVRYADARTAIATGSLDLATIGPADLPIALSQNIDTFQALMGIGSSPKYIVARNGVEIESWEDLIGKKVAIAPGSAVWFQFVATLTENDVPYDEIEIVNIQGGGSNFNQALERGDVDAIITWEPFESTPVVEGYGYWVEGLDYSQSEAVGAELGMMAVSTAAYEQKLDAVKLFVEAYIAEQDRLSADKAAFAEAVTAWTGIEGEIATRIADTIDLGAVLSLEQMQRQAKTFHELGVIQTDVSDRIPDFYRGELVEEVTGG